MSKSAKKSIPSVSKFKAGIEALELAKVRWDFLWEQDGPQRQPLYTLHAPDFAEPKWNVFCSATKKTVGRGDNAGAAVDNAIDNVS